jgi:hypothetical protein
MSSMLLFVDSERDNAQRSIDHSSVLMYNNDEIPMRYDLGAQFKYRVLAHEFITLRKKRIVIFEECIWKG